MNAAVEQGFADYLQAVLTAADMEHVKALPGTGTAKVPTTDSSVIVVLKMPRTVGSYYRAEMKLIVSTPINVDGPSLETHKSLTRFLKDVIAWEKPQSPEEQAEADAKTAAINLAVRNASDFETRGFWLQTVSDAQDDKMWQAQYDMIWGLEGPLPPVSP